jgi:hypothetical protein
LVAVERVDDASAAKCGAKTHDGDVLKAKSKPSGSSVTFHVYVAVRTIMLLPILVPQ